MDDKTEAVRTGLEELVRAHATDADLSGIDEIVLNYVTGVIEEVGGGDEEMDTAGMKDVITAYVHDFEEVPESAVHTWVIDMVYKIQEIIKDNPVKISLDPLVSAIPGSQKCHNSSYTSETHELSCKLSEAHGTSPKLPEASLGSEHDEYFDDIALLLEMFPTACDLEVQHCIATSGGDLEEATSLILQRQEQQISLKSPSASKHAPTLDEKMVKESTCETTESTHKLSEAIGSSNKLPETSHGSEHNEYSDVMAHLLEMFPATSNLEVQHCLASCQGDLEEAVSLILQRQEQQVSLEYHSASKADPVPDKRMKERNLKKNGFIDKDRQYYRPVAPEGLGIHLKAAPVPDKKIRETIMNKYGFVDNEEDRRDHRPVTPKGEDKKMLRYRDSKVVSSKGERFTVIKKEEPEEMKKTYVNIRPWRRYRFH